MTADLLPKAPPRATYVTLTAALTWLRYDHACELMELLAWADRLGPRRFELMCQLTEEWLKLADYACEGHLAVRGRRVGRFEEVRLTEDDLRNSRHVGWRSDTDATLSIDPFEFTFAGGFRSYAEPDLRGFHAVYVSRSGLLGYKRVRHRRSHDSLSADSWKAARAWLHNRLESLEPMPGLKAHCIDQMTSEFHVSKSRAEELWTSTASELGWPLHGRPTNVQREKLRTILKRGRVLE